MMTSAAALQRLLWRGLARADAWMNRLYGWRWNPLYQSGALAAVLMAVVVVTGLYLLLFYRVGAPYESVARITEQVWAGRWIRSLHRYASDAAVVAALVHAFRIFAQGRGWGPRALAWVSGLFLLFVVWACGWTGYVMVWDVHGEWLAREGARLLDVLPIFSEPLSRAFVGEGPIPSAFFFLNLFLHVALPIGLGLLLWLHVSRVARPTLWPPRGLAWGAIGLLFVVSVLWPIGMAPEADPLRLPESVPVDVFYSFWLPWTRGVPAGVAWAVGGGVALALLLEPLWARPSRAARSPASRVDERHCTGCRQCYLDCPYEAIAMVPRTDGRAEAVAQVDPGLCVSCGICAGSCAPMRVGPPARTGRDQLAEVRAFLGQRTWGPEDVVVVACERGAGGVARRAPDGVWVYAVACAGSVHSSAVEFLLRGGVGGVLMLACPARDCWNREGPKWMEARLYHDREAELHERVDRRRVRVAYVAAAERGAALREIAAFREIVVALHAASGEEEFDLIRMCEAVGGEAGP